MRPKNTLLSSLIALGLSSGIWALPQDPTPVHGQVQIQNGANFVQILQQTPQAIINWNQFNIGLGETVRFLQPSQQAAILNRVTGLDPSIIQGMLQANGRVFLLNPNGILFGPNSVVDVGSFTASTLKMSNEDFLNGTYKLTQDNSLPLAALTNQGSIRVAEGGFVVLVSPLLDNQGMILAQSGHVNLGATTQATFSVDGRGLVQFVVPDGFDPQFRGGGHGGTVLLQPGQMSSLLSQVVTNPALVEAGSFQAGNNGQVLAHGAEGVLLNSGTISTDSASGNGGTIRLDSSQATILPASGVLSANSQTGNAGDVRLLSAGRTFSLGTISAAANGTGNGGFAEVSGKDLWLLGTVNVASAQGAGGTILLDPTDITIIDGAGGTFDGQLPNPNGAGAGSVSVTAMQGQSAVQLNATNDVLYSGAGFNLGSTSLSVNAGNDIQFSGPSIQATTLTLMAGRDITITSPNSLTVGSTAGAFTAQAGRHVTLTANSGNLVLTSPVQTSVTATAGHLNTSSSGGSGTYLNAPVTNLSAGGNVTMSASDVLQSTGNTPVFLSGRNVTLQSQGAGLNYRVGALNVTATENLLGTASNGLTLRAFSGPLQMTAGGSLTASGSGLVLQSDAGKVNLDGASVSLNAPSSGLSVSGSQGVNATASSGDFGVTAPGGSIGIGTTTGTVNVTASRDVFLLAGSGNLALNGPGGSRIVAGRHLNTASSGGSGTFLDGARTDLIAGQNLTTTASDILQSTGNNPVFLNGRNVTMQSQGGGMNSRVGALNVIATENFAAGAANGLTLRSINGPLQITAGGTLTVSGSGVLVQSDSGKVNLDAASVAVNAPSGGLTVSGSAGVNATASNGDFSLTAPGGAVALTANAGTVNVTASQDVRLLAGSGNLAINGATGSRTVAGRDLRTASSQGSGTFLDGARTDLIAGQNLTMTTSDVLQSTGSTPVYLSGRNVTIQSQGAGMNLRVGSLNVSAAEDFVSTACNGLTLRSINGPLQISAANALSATGSGMTIQSDAGIVNLDADRLILHAPNGSSTVSAAAGVNATARNGDFSLTASSGAVNLGASSGTLNVTASRDVILLAGSGNLALNGPNGTRIAATRHISTENSQGSGTYLDGNRTELVAGQNLTMTTSDVLQSTGNNPVFLNGQNVTIQSQGAGMNLRVGALNVTATEDFVSTAGNGLVLRSISGPLEISAGNSLSVTGSGILIQSDSSKVNLDASSQTLNAPGGALTVSASNGVNATARGGDFSATATSGAVNLGTSTGTLNVTASQDVRLLAGSGNLALNGPAGSRVTAGRHITTTSSQGSGTYLDGGQTDLVAGQNLTMTTSDVLQSTGNNPVFLNARNVTIQSQGAGMNLRVGALNATATEDFVSTASNGLTLRTITGPLQISAGNSLSASGNGILIQSDADKVNLEAASIALNAPGGAVTVSASQGINATASSGDFSAIATFGAVNLGATSGTLNVTAAQDVRLAAGSGNLALNGPAGARVAAGRDLNTASSQGSGTYLDGTRTDLVAGRNLAMTTSDVLQSTGNNPVFLNGHNVTVQSQGAGVNLRVGALNVTATGDFVGQANNAFSMRSFSGPLQVDAGGNLSVTAGGGSLFQADTGGVEVSAGNLALSNVAINAGSNGDVKLASAGNLTVGPIATGSSANATLTGANITIQSMQNISGGNYTITTPGNLTEITPATNPPTLTGLNITAGKAFNFNRSDLGFSIPNAGFLAGLVTGGNETLPAPNDARAASFHTFTAGPDDFSPGHVEFQTGDIYRDGVKIYGGSPPPDPPPTPPAPPPVPSPPAPPVDIPVTPQEAVQQQNALSPEQRSQILAQSNLALGNLGSFSRVLSDSEREVITTRHDSLHQTWSLDPFSPTLALTVPGGAPPVYPSELAQLTALLMMSSPSDDPEDKTRQAYNVIVDQELREIWEVRYWRHLLEDIIIWEDRE